jgi:tetratricopeptide (TPR) repeat protein
MSVLFILLGIIAVGAVSFLGVFLFKKLNSGKNEYHQVEQALETGNFEKAKNICLRLVDSNPGDFVIRYYLGQAYEGLKNFAQAIFYYEKAAIYASSATDESLKVRFYLKIADIYRRTKKTKEALGYYALVLDKDSSNYKALLASAEINYDLKNLTKAKTHLEEFIQVKPDHFKGRFLLGKICSQLNQLQDATLHLGYILENNQTDSVLNANTALLLADIYQNMKVFPKVIEILTPLLDDEKYFEDVLCRIIEAHIQMENYEEARQLIEGNRNNVSNDKKALLSYLRGTSYYREKRFYKAIQSWTEAYELDPQLRDLPDIMNRYQVIIKNPFLEMVFSEEDDRTDALVKRLFRYSVTQKIMKRPRYWIIDNKENSVVLYRAPFVVSAPELAEMEELIRRNFQFGSYYTLYSLFGVAEMDPDNYNLKKVEIISGDQFLRNLSAVL